MASSVQKSALYVWSLLTGDLCHHRLRDPTVPEERFNLLFHHAAIPPTEKKNKTALLSAQIHHLENIEHHSAS